MGNLAASRQNSISAEAVPTKMWREYSGNDIEYESDSQGTLSHYLSPHWESLTFPSQLDIAIFRAKHASRHTCSLENSIHNVNLLCSTGCQINIKKPHDSLRPRFQENISLFDTTEQLTPIEIIASPGACLISAKLPPDISEKTKRSILQRWPQTSSAAPLNIHLPLSRNLNHILNEVFQDAFLPEFKGHIIQGKLYEMISELTVSAPTHISTTTTQASESLTITQKAKEILHSRYKSPPSLEQLARSIGTNRNKLSGSFKAIHGQTVFEYIQQYRMSMAKKILCQQKCSIAHVAELMGYEHPGNFTSAYKRHFGELPKATRKLR